jgi:tetratricopeptide (TPR) repeat protein
MERIEGLIGKNPPEQSPGFLNFLQFKGMHEADLGNLSGAEAIFKRAIAVAAKFGGAGAAGVASNEINLAITYMRLQKFEEAIGYLKSALESFRNQGGDHALYVGYTLAALANAYAGKGDQGTSARFRAAALEILGPGIGNQPEPNWL